MHDREANWDEEEDRYRSPFAEWLEEQGFTKHKRIEKSWFRCSSVYVDTEEKIYAPRMPGVAFYEAIDGIELTTEMFKIVYFGKEISGN